MVIPKVANYSGMTISINQQLHDVAEYATLQSIVLAQLGDQQNGIAIAVNHKVIPKAERVLYILKEGDQILIIKATQGG